MLDLYKKALRAAASAYNPVHLRATPRAFPPAGFMATGEIRYPWWLRFSMHNYRYFLTKYVVLPMKNLYCK